VLLEEEKGEAIQTTEKETSKVSSRMIRSTERNKKRAELERIRDAGLRIRARERDARLRSNPRELRDRVIRGGRKIISGREVN